MEKDRSKENHILTIRRGMGCRHKTLALFIEGKYLEKLDFPIGTKIAIQCSNGEADDQTGRHGGLYQA